MKIIKKIFFTIITIFLILLVMFNIYNFYCIKILKQDLVSINGYAVLEVVSGSMEPTIHVGDLVIINTNEKNYQKDDIVTFRDVDDSFVTHRIKEINKDKMITRGDNNDSDDQPMEVNRLIGKYLFKINGLGTLFAAFKSPFVMVMILVIGILTCILTSVDKDGNPILSESEREFQEFQEYKKKQSKEELFIEEDKKKEKKKINNNKKKETSKKTTTVKKETSKKTTAVKKEAPKKTMTVKKETSKKTTTVKKETPKKTTTAKKEAPKKTTTVKKETPKKTNSK